MSNIPRYEANDRGDGFIVHDSEHRPFGWTMSVESAAKALNESAAKDAEIARLRAEVDRVRAQRDNAAKLLWGECEGDLGTGKGDVLLHGIGLHYDGDEVKEIEG